MKVQKEPKIKEIQIFNKNYRVQEQSGNDSQNSYFQKITNSWLAKQQGLKGKEKKQPKVFQRNFEQENTYYEKEKVYYEKKIQVEEVKEEVKKIEEQQEEQKQEKKYEDEIIREIKEVKEQNEKQEQLEFTHFISLPLNNSELIKQITHYQKEFINSDGKLKHYVQDAKKSHVTLIPLVLNTDKKIERAKKVIQTLKSKIDEIIEQSEEGQLKINVKGIGTFGAGPRKARVLYAKISNGTKEIQELTNIIVKELRSAKLIQANQLQHYEIKDDKIYLQQIHVTMFKTSK